MPRWLRWIGFALLGLVTVLDVALVVVYLVSSSHLSRTYRFPDAGVAAATIRSRWPVAIAWRRSSASAPYAMGRTMAARSWPTMPRSDGSWAVNLTAGKGGIGDYTDADFERAIRHGVRRTGHPWCSCPPRPD